MTIRNLDRSEWQEFCDTVTKSLIGRKAEIEIDSLALGNQTAARSLPLYGIAYDPKEDILEIALEGLDHMIHKPRKLFADMGPAGLLTLGIIDDDGARQIVKLHDPLMLPPSEQQAGHGARS